MHRPVRVCEGDGGVRLRLVLFLCVSVSKSLFEPGPGLRVCMRRRGGGRGMLRVVIEDDREDAHGREPHARERGVHRREQAQDAKAVGLQASESGLDD